MYELMVIRNIIFNLFTIEISFWRNFKQELILASYSYNSTNQFLNSFFQLWLCTFLFIIYLLKAKRRA